MVRQVIEEDYDSNIGFLLNDVARHMRTIYDRRMAKLGLTRSQWWVLSYLFFNEGITQTEFARLLDMEKAALGRLLYRMEEKGWIERRSEAEDRRSKHVYLGGKAGPTIKKMRDLAAVTRDEALRSLDDAERGQIRDMLRRMRDDLSAISNNDLTMNAEYDND